LFSQLTSFPHLPELHIVHLREGGNLEAFNDAAVLGFKIDAGAQTTNDFFEFLLCGWEKEAFNTTELCEFDGSSDDAINIYETFLAQVDDDWSTFTYDGGLTNPPCLEIVQVRKEIRPIQRALEPHTRARLKTF